MTSGRLDPVVLEILWNRLITVANEQAAALQRTSFTPIVRESGDLSAAVFDAYGRMLAQAVTGTPGHINSLATSMRHFIAHSRLTRFNRATSSSPMIRGRHRASSTISPSSRPCSMGIGSWGSSATVVTPSTSEAEGCRPTQAKCMRRGCGSP